MIQRRRTTTQLGKLSALAVSVLLLPLVGCAGPEPWAPADEAGVTSGPTAKAKAKATPKATPKKAAPPSKSGGKRCVIKGNVSYNTGERIYHVPGQKYYEATIITASKGERWFCTEAQARAAGWRKSRV
jgi:hypothetical protein